MQLPNEVQILFVEDNPSHAELTIRALKKRNLANHLLHVRDGEAALEWLFCQGDYAYREISQLPKLVLLDLKLPKVDGLEVLAAIRADERFHKIPVVLLTSSKEQQDIMRGYSLGVNSYIVKPVDFEKFSNAVAEAGHYWLLLNSQPG